MNITSAEKARIPIREHAVYYDLCDTVIRDRNEILQGLLLKPTFPEQGSTLNLVSEIRFEILMVNFIRHLSFHIHMGLK